METDRVGDGNRQSERWKQTENLRDGNRQRT